jgi:hypothetical protein
VESGDKAERLRQAAADFATNLTVTVQSTFGPQVAPFEATARVGDSRGRISVLQNPSLGIELAVDRQPCLLLKVEYWCTWDSAEAYLAVDESKIRVLPARDNEPLFRYEYLRGPDSGQPCSHLHFHAHRDAFTHAMVRSGEGSPRARRRRQSLHRRGDIPRMRELHFPLGGHRFRPCLEDVLHMLIDEFGVDTIDGAMNALADGRELWRVSQIAASTRDDPEAVAREMTKLGYKLTPPSSGHPPHRTERLRTY